MFPDPPLDSALDEPNEAERPLVVVASGAPPGIGGTSLVVHRVLSAPGMPTLRVFADRRVRRRVRAGAGAILPGRYRWLWKAPTTSKAPRPLQWLFGCLNLLSAVSAGLRAARVCRSEEAGWVLSVVDSGISQIAGAIAARRAGVPHVLWVLDLWEENTYPKFDRLVARHLERRLWRSAAAILVHSEEAGEHYAVKHGVHCRVLRTPIRDPDQSPPRSSRDSRPEILCAGALYWAQADAVRRLERAAARLGSDLTLTILSDDETLTADAIPADRVERGVPEARFRARLAEADLLFLGLSFDTAYPAIIRTAAPARFPEYLATGVPVIVHAPPGSHVVQRAKELDVAEVVDQPSDEMLSNAIRTVLEDPQTAAERASRARAAALEHDHRIVAAQLVEILRRTRNPRGPGAPWWRTARPERHQLKSHPDKSRLGSVEQELGLGLGLSAAEANRRYYALRAADYDRTEECVTQERNRRRLRRVLTLATTSARGHERILDACGGSGYASLELGAMGLDAVTVDISPEMLEMYARKASSAGLPAQTKVSEIGSFLAACPEPWDLIVFSSALHHLDDYRAVLLAASEGLAEGGVVATVFDPTAPGRLGRLIRYVDYLLWLAVRQPFTFVHRLRERATRRGADAPSVGRLAERHALSGIDDVALAKRLEEQGLEILLHEREFEARFPLVRMALRLLAQPSAFSFVARRPAEAGALDVYNPPGGERIFGTGRGDRLRQGG